MSEEINRKMSQYLSGRLSNKEKEAFEKMLEENPDLLDNLENNELVRDMRKKLRRIALRKEIHQVRTQQVAYQPKARKRFLNHRIIYWSAAAACLIGLFVYLTWFSSSTTHDVQIFAMLETLKPVESLSKGNADSILLLAYSAFNREDYTQAEFQFKSAIEEDPAYDITNMWLGLSQLYQKDYSEALASFKTPSLQGTLYKERIDLYQAMSLILLDRKSEAESLLNQLIEQETDFVEEAQQLLKRL